MYAASEMSNTDAMELTRKECFWG
jgi:hypothetical protein